MGSSWSRDDVLACLAVLALLAVPGCGVVMWLGAGAGLWTAIVVGCSAVVAAVAGYLAHHARLDFVAGGHQYRVATMQNALDQALARVEVLQKKLRDQESELRHEQGFVKDLIDSCEARRLRIAELERELVAAKAESATDTVRELRRARRDLESLRNGFDGFLQAHFKPLGAEYGRVTKDAEECHRRMTELIESLDGHMAVLGFEDGVPVLKLRLPTDPVVTFAGREGQRDRKALEASRRKLANVFHSDKTRHLGLEWVTEMFDAIFKYLQHQRERLESATRAAS